MVVTAEGATAPAIFFFLIFSRFIVARVLRWENEKNIKN